MAKYDVLNLYDHNIKAYENVEIKLHNSNVASIVHATGTGKSYTALQLALENKDKNIFYVVPNKSIIEHLKEIIKKANLDLTNDLPNLNFKTYHSLIKLNEEEIKELEIDYLILDEFHHIGAPVWGARVNAIINTHPNIKIFGMTAYTVRDRGTSFERDMIDPETEEIFSNTTVSKYDLCDAMIDGILPKPIYKSAYINILEMYQTVEDKVDKIDHKKEKYKQYKELLKDIKRRIHEAKSIKDLFKQNIKPNGKYIYFCPLNREAQRNDIDTIREEVKSWIEYSGIEEYEFYTTTSGMGKDGKQNRDAFYNDVDLKGNDVKNKLRIMFAINQYNEGVHAPGLDGVIMGRSTKSDIVFFEQLGRALSIGKDNKEEYDKLIQYNEEELYKMCIEKDIKVKEKITKKELVDLLLSPIIIDLTNNIEFIKELENNLKYRVKEIYNDTDGIRNIHLGSTSFDIDLINEDLFKRLENLDRRMSLTWEDYYELACSYYKHYGNLNILQKFKTKDGINYDEEGVKLGIWISKQRDRYNNVNSIPLTSEHINLLNEIGMFWNIHEAIWQERYDLAKKYYKHYGDLDILLTFKTINGIDYDENGICLGRWVINLRKLNNKNKLTKEKIDKLNEIGMIWKIYKSDWQEKYELVKKYYEYYGNLDMPYNFKTINGIDYNEKGINISRWIHRQRENKKQNKLISTQIDLLNNLGMIWDKTIDDTLWQERYKLAKTYYEHYGNLNILYNFKTLNGIDYDENGVNLGQWIISRRKSYNKNKLSKEKIDKLNEIGMIWNANEAQWLYFYNLAKKYYEHYGNLKMTYKFKTKDGIDYDENGVNLGMWLLLQKKAYNGLYTGANRTDEQIKLLESIGINWKIKDKKESWQEKYELAKKYYEHYGHLKISESFKTKDGINYDEEGINLGTWVATQKALYKGKRDYDFDKIKLLESIGIVWYNELKDLKLQKQIIEEKNLLTKKKEILNRFYSLLNEYNLNELPNKEELNESFIRKLTIK